MNMYLHRKNTLQNTKYLIYWSWKDLKKVYKRRQSWNNIFHDGIGTSIRAYGNLRMPFHNEKSACSVTKLKVRGSPEYLQRKGWISSRGPWSSRRLQKFGVEPLNP